MNKDVIYIDTDHFKPPEVSSDLMKCRENVAAAQQQMGRTYVTITVTAYNRLEKTRRCIESVLKYTEDIDYELILFDNGSSDGTLEYFQAVPHEKKTIIHTTKNQGAGFAIGTISMMRLGRYLVGLPNDVIVTKNWLKNMLICAESDPSIGMVCPLSSNMSNLQSMSMEFHDYEEMQDKAARYNVSDPRKWEERLRLVTNAPLYKKEAVMAVGFPLTDSGFMHDFGDDDLSFRIRRMGYRLILTKDVWIHHDHAFDAAGGRDLVQLQKSLYTGRENFRKKYWGIDAWDDVNNYMHGFVDQIKIVDRTGEPNILGIDVRCGTPILEIRNMLRRSGCMKSHAFSFSQNSLYETDLKTVCDGTVACDREEFLLDYFPKGYFDYIVMDKPVNCYHEPQKMINDMMELSKKGAVLILKLQNTFGFYEFLNLLGQRDVYNPGFAYNIPLELIVKTLEKSCRILFIHPEKLPLSEEDGRRLHGILEGCVPEGQLEECFFRMTVETFVVGVERI